MRAWPLLAVVALGGCQHYSPRTQLPPPEAPGAPLGQKLSVDAQPGGGRTAEEWHELLRDEVLTGGWIGGETGPLLHVHATRRVIPDRGSEALHILTAACFPSRATVLVRVSAIAQHAGGISGYATASVEVDRSSSLFLIFYPPAWGLEPGADLLADAVRSATRVACARLQQALGVARAGTPGVSGVGTPGAAGGDPAAAGTCPACEQPVDPAWIACPRCAASLKD